MSVFTFDPDGSDSTRVASPWLRPADASQEPTVMNEAAGRKGTTGSGLLSDYGLTKLLPEPQEGPIEYKLHLLLRPRRRYEQSSTASQICGSVQSRPPPDPKSFKSAAPFLSGSTTSAQTKQDRLEHLTTQLLWRLQQSCPYHAGMAVQKLVIPKLPTEYVSLDAPVKLEKVLPGLEASRGALYEIGVADDGSLAGLTKDELDESLATLRVMAASLGCVMQVLRRVAVGDCEWIETDQSGEVEPNTLRRKAKLWVAEALVTPDLGPRDSDERVSNSSSGTRPVEAVPDPKNGPLSTDQLRITLTGPTTSGKSTLLGTLSTGTLDNGRGSCRVSMFKHQHEIASGVTSSVAYELLGYVDDDVINYGHSGVESWIDIHDFTKAGRLVYMVDTAGVPRYWHTGLRGVIGWAPHWTLLCIGADSDTSDTPGGELAISHLEFCLRLRLPLVVVVTKLDLAKTKDSLKVTLNKILSSIKRANRTPMVVPPDPTDHADLSRVSPQDQARTQRILDALNKEPDPLSVVPIVLTSCHKGRGIGSLHALIRGLPLPPTPTSHDYIGAALNPEQPACLFHVEDKYSLPASYAFATSDTNQQTDRGTVVAGYLRFGSLSIGDKVVVGPFKFPSDEDSGSPTDTPGDRSPNGRSSGGRSPAGAGHGFSSSHPSSTTDLSRIASRNTVSASAIKGEWHTASIVSIRNLRLPVQTLGAGQVGTIGIIFDPLKQDDGAVGHPSTTPRLRRGMVLAVPSQHMVSSGLSLQAVSGLTAFFDQDNRDVASLSVGTLVKIYVASVRVSARILRVSAVSPQDQMATDEIDDDMFSLADDESNGQNGDAQVQSGMESGGVEVQLELINRREWVELGSRILIHEGGSLGSFVGKVVEIVE
ncbi:GTP-binding protein 2 [Podospora fimiseda]|uniref:GTP-binding protein 2 n=1 Tax=Podospora fimiseda TaxID=252190 RepID=A0AAN7BW09_9PEZI|nr:GTP-binding protein 2 [Podospora fimiseda]